MVQNLIKEEIANLRDKDLKSALSGVELFFNKLLGANQKNELEAAKQTETIKTLQKENEKLKEEKRLISQQRDSLETALRRLYILVNELEVDPELDVTNRFDFAQLSNDSTTQTFVKESQTDRASFRLQQKESMHRFSLSLFQTYHGHLAQVRFLFPLAGSFRSFASVADDGALHLRSRKRKMPVEVLQLFTGPVTAAVAVSSGLLVFFEQNGRVSFFLHKPIQDKWAFAVPDSLQTRLSVVELGISIHYFALGGVCALDRMVVAAARRNDRLVFLSSCAEFATLSIENLLVEVMKLVENGTTSLFSSLEWRQLSNEADISVRQVSSNSDFFFLRTAVGDSFCCSLEKPALQKLVFGDGTAAVTHVLQLDEVFIASTKEQLAVIEAPKSSENKVLVFPDGNSLIVNTNDTVQLASFPGNGKFFLSLNKEANVKVWELRKDKLVLVWELTQDETHSTVFTETVTALVCDKNGIFTGGADGLIKCFKVNFP